MKTLIFNITETKNPFINTAVALTLTLIAVTLLYLVGCCIVDPSHITNASY
ncbi:hypothetical protein [Thalassobellus suaedae]|uniref:Uncharacterized protein n=1 Tax=Thalassobellus suaedae TaxID=3074124 RepID=A0ABY9XVU8_9FLAO|nr:hypothetical protein RHP51_05080 [Flavobacteriaceae bacterium HL-DH14]